MLDLHPGSGKYVWQRIPPPNRAARWFASLAIGLFFGLVPAAICSAQSSEPKRVLILMQEDLSWPIFRQIDENVRATLLRGTPEGIVFFSEYLDRMHFPDPALQAQRAVWIKRKYANSPLDLVVGAGDLPGDLFPNVPFVQISVGPARQITGRRASQAETVGIWVNLDVVKTLEAARRFQPNARKIVVINGSSPSEKQLLDRVREEIDSIPSPFEVVYLTDLSFSETSKRVSVLGPESIVLFVSLARDSEGHAFIPAESIGKIAAASGAPVYGLFDTHIGSGAVGGYVTRYGEIGKQAGEAGLQLLAGKHPMDEMARSDYVFDAPQLKRWKIPESALPAGSIVINRHPGIWQTYKWYLIGAALLILMEALLIVGLLWNRAKRMKYEKSLLERVEFETMLSEHSATFINMPGGQIGATIENSLEGIAKFLRLDRITLLEYSPASAHLTVASSWRDEKVLAIPKVIEANKLPWLTERLLRGETVLVSSLEELPEEANAEWMHLRKYGAGSVAAVPLKAGEELLGAISFATADPRTAWTEDLVEQLKLIAAIFSNALARKKAHDERFSHAAIVESSDDAIIAKNLDGLILSWNPGAQRLFEYTAGEAIGKPITMLIPEDLYHEETKILARIKAGERLEHYETVRVAKNGRKFHVSLTVSPIRDSTGAIVGASKIARDISERKRALQILRESEERFRLVANTAPVLIWMSDEAKYRTFANQGWLKFTGRTLEQELGDGWMFEVHPDDQEQCEETYEAAFEARSDFEREFRLRRADGEYRWMVDFGVPRFESDGTFRGYIGSCVDITERKASEESIHKWTGRLINAQEEERARIARELHDDFSQRLALLGIGLGQLWKKLPASEVDERIKVMEMLKATKEMSTDIHTLSHQLHSSKLEHVGLVPALNGLCREIGEKYGIEVEFIPGETPVRVPKEVGLCLFRVAQESLGNVVKHSKAKNARLQIAADGENVSLCISDDGKGFNAEVENPGAGIGLIGMTERLRLVGGTLLVRSEPNQGTEIFAEVPLGKATNEAELKAQAVGE